MNTKITGEMCVIVLWNYGHTYLRASEIAALLKTDSRAVATALRKPVKDGRIKLGWAKSSGVALYKFVRKTPKRKGGTA